MKVALPFACGVTTSSRSAFVVGEYLNAPPRRQRQALGGYNERAEFWAAFSNVTVAPTPATVRQGG